MVHAIEAYASTSKNNNPISKMLSIEALKLLGGSIEKAVEAMRAGAWDFVTKPFHGDELQLAVSRALEHGAMRKENQTLRAAGQSEEVDMVASAPAMQNVLAQLEVIAEANADVLLTGESGVGKEVAAKWIHEHSPRKDGGFLAVNCAALPGPLLESELFGHEKGAFTGATAQRRGRFEQADGGTLFLDEIGDMPPDTQTRLLRVLADGEFYRVGGHLSVKADVRIIAATHQNLEALVKDGRFREDLFHRLNVIRVHLPRLAERREDIPRLAQHFLAEAAKELSTEPKVLTRDAELHLTRLPWPGNVRQLENTCRWLTVMASGREVLIDDLPPELRDVEGTEAASGDWRGAFREWADRALAAGHTHLLEEAVPDFERILIETALKHTGGRKGEAAELLGWGRNTLTRKLKVLLPALAEE